jgi:hypothetical protein
VPAGQFWQGAVKKEEKIYPRKVVPAAFYFIPEEGFAC